MRGKVVEVMGRVEGERKGRKRKGWWDEECRQVKKKVRKELRKWRRVGDEKIDIGKRKGGIGECVKRRRKRKWRDGWRK